MSDATPPIQKFTFNVSAGEESRTDINLKIDALEDRIDNIVKRVEVQGIPLLQHILALSHDKVELERLGKALIRVSELAPELDELKRRKSILELALSDPGWLAATFGDFDQEIDSLINDDLK